MRGGKQEGKGLDEEVGVPLCENSQCMARL